MDPNERWLWWGLNSGVDQASYPQYAIYNDGCHGLQPHSEYYQQQCLQPDSRGLHYYVRPDSAVVYQPYPTYSFPPQFSHWPQAATPAQVPGPVYYNFTPESWASLAPVPNTFPVSSSNVKVSKVPPWSQSNDKNSASDLVSVKKDLPTPETVKKVDAADGKGKTAEVKIPTPSTNTWRKTELVISVEGDTSSDEDSVKVDKSQGVQAKSHSSPQPLKSFEENTNSHNSISLKSTEEISEEKVTEPQTLKGYKEYELETNDNDIRALEKLNLQAHFRENTLASKLSKHKMYDDDLQYCTGNMGDVSTEKQTDESLGKCFNNSKQNTIMKGPEENGNGIAKLPVPEPAKASFELQRKMYQQLVDLYDDFEQECERANLDAEKVDLASYVEDSWPYIAKSVVDPTILSGSDLAQVGRVIVTRALEDPGYLKIAVRLIDLVFQKELMAMEGKGTSGQFRKGVVKACVEAVESWDVWVKKGLHFCLTLVEFLSSTFQTLRVSSNHLGTLGATLLDLLMVIATPPAVHNFELVQQLCCVLHDCGKILDTASEQKMDQLISQLRDAVVDPDVDPTIRHTLLGPIELRASGWHFTSAAQKYYFS